MHTNLEEKIMKEVKYELEQDDLNVLHDVALGALECDSAMLTAEFLTDMFNKLPHFIKAEANTWGLSDTVVRDSIYGHLEELQETQEVNLRIHES